MTTTAAPAHRPTFTLRHVGYGHHRTTDGRFMVARVTDGYRITDRDPGTAEGWSRRVADLPAVHVAIAAILDAEWKAGHAAAEPGAPVRADSVLVGIPQTCSYATADARFTAAYVDAHGAYTVTDHGRGADPIGERLTLVEARQMVARVADAEYRNDRLAYTDQLAAIDPAVATQVAAMRSSAAAHGRVTGSTGAYWSETRGGEPGAVELTVYVGRDEYAAALGEVEPADTSDRDRAIASVREQLASLIGDLAILATRSDDGALLAARHAIRDLAEVAERLALTVRG